MTSDSFQPVLRTDSSSYRQAEMVEVQLKAGSQTVGYNLCFGYAGLERFDADGWRPVRANLGPDEETGCTAELRGLPPLHVARNVVYLPRDLPAGTYRLAYDLEIGGNRSKYRSNPFSVGPRGP